MQAVVTGRCYLFLQSKFDCTEKQKTEHLFGMRLTRTYVRDNISVDRTHVLFGDVYLTIAVAAVAGIGTQESWRCVLSEDYKG